MGNSTEADPLLGRRIGNYQVVQLLARGGMGAVYLGEHPEIGRRVAIKVLFPSLTAQPGFAERFVAEAKVLARLDHPNIIQIFDFGRTEHQLYYVMELLEGGDLAGYLAERGQLSAIEAWPVMQQICSALQAAHDHGIVHRDLKLENIFIQRRAPLTLKLLDFGIAKVLDSSFDSHWRTTTGMVVGTPVFMAPEQAAGRADKIGVQTDVYAVGVLLYLLLTGEPPFWADTAPELLCKHLHDPPPPLVSGDPSQPRELAELAHRCLAKQPGDRPASAREVAQSFALIIGVPVEDPVLLGAALPDGQPPLVITAERTRPVDGSDQTVPLPSGLSPLRVESRRARQEEPPTRPDRPRRTGGQTGPPQPTTISTLSSSVGEFWPDGDPLPGRRIGRSVAVGILLGALGAAGLLVHHHLDSGSDDGAPRKAPVATRLTEAQRATVPAARPRTEPLDRSADETGSRAAASDRTPGAVTLTVTGATRCSYAVDGGPVQTVVASDGICRLVVARDAEVALTVERAGAGPLERRLQASRDLQLTVDTADQQLWLAGEQPAVNATGATTGKGVASSASARDDAAADEASRARTGPRGRATRPRRRHRGQTGRSRSTGAGAATVDHRPTTDRPTDEPVEKKVPKQVGAGTMDF